MQSIFIEIKRFKKMINLFNIVCLLGTLSFVEGINVTSFGFDLNTLTGESSQPGIQFPNRELAYLLSNAVKEDSAILAFSFYAISFLPVILQIYRPSNDSAFFMLVDQFTFTPSVLNQRENIYVESVRQNCIRVKVNDRLAVYSKNGPLSLQNHFNAVAMTNYADNEQIYKVNSTVKFQLIKQPSDVYVGAYAYKLAENEACLFNQLLPESENLFQTTVLPITGRPGVMGATGVTGPPGDIGQLGPIGPPGAQGDKGKPGFQGPAGYTGARGPLGDMGEPGPMGSQGYTGKTGPVGLMGAMGPTGLKGDTGRSLYVDLKRIEDSPQDPLAATVKQEQFMSTPTAIWGAFIWAGIISIIALVTMVILVAICCAKNRIKHE